MTNLEDVRENDNKRRWGGKRSNAGRKKGETRKTKVVRVPEEVDIQKLLSLKEDLESLVHAWKREMHSTSPRYEAAKILLDEIEILLR